MNRTIGQKWRALRDNFADAGIPTAALDARLLVRHVLGFDETALIALENDSFPDSKTAELESLAIRRLAGEPIARMLGVQEFYGLPFVLNSATLIPRPETEMLVDFGIGALESISNPRILDLGTGTGCIVLALLANLPKATGIGVDLAPDAVEQAHANGALLGLSDRFEARQGDWFSPVETQSFDLIVSNPPYIASAVIERLETGVKAFDPRAALDGGEDGLAPYRIIARNGRFHLAPNGFLALEIGFDQGHIVSALLTEAGFDAVSLAKDLAGHDRMVTARWQGDALK